MDACKTSHLYTFIHSVLHGVCDVIRRRRTGRKRRCLALRAASTTGSWANESRGSHISILIIRIGHPLWRGGKRLWVYKSIIIIHIWPIGHVQCTLYNVILLMSMTMVMIICVRCTSIIEDFYLIRRYKYRPWFVFKYYVFCMLIFQMWVWYSPSDVCIAAWCKYFGTGNCKLGNMRDQREQIWTMQIQKYDNLSGQISFWK